MLHRSEAAREFSSWLGTLAHPDRLRIVEELGAGEHDVSSLSQRLGLLHSRISQHLSLLRTHRIVIERRQGRHVHYRLAQPGLAAWLTTGLSFLETSPYVGAEIRDAVHRAREEWSDA